MRFLMKSGRRSPRRSPSRPPRASRRATPSRTNLLEAINPSIIDPSSVQSAAGATAVRNGALSRLRTRDGRRRKHLAVRRPAGRRMGHQLDVRAERRDRPAPDSAQQLDGQRRPARALPRAHRRPTRRSRCSTSTSRRRRRTSREMYFARGFAEMQLASDFCNGIPLSDGAGDVATLRKRRSR